MSLKVTISTVGVVCGNDQFYFFETLKEARAFSKLVIAGSQFPHAHQQRMTTIHSSQQGTMRWDALEQWVSKDTSTEGEFKLTAKRNTKF